MSRLILILAFCLCGSLAQAQVPMEPSIVGDKTNHELSWNTSLNYFYQVDCSVDLQTWVWTGLEAAGTGSRLTYGFMSTSDKMFYRIRASVDPNNGGFLVEPQQDDTINQIDGVCFAFNLNQFSALPSKIRIFERDYNTGDPWNLIGSITAFDERQIPAESIDEKFMRGSAVWLPSSQGDYEVQAAVVDSTGAVIASAIRRITIAQKQAPTISIVSGPSNSSSAISLDGSFDLDPGDTVTRVEFYDNGTLVGTAVQEEFEDTVQDLQGEDVALLRGSHSIVVRAYDSTGVLTDTAPYAVTVTGGNARPVVNVTAPQTDLVLVEGDTFAIEYDPPTDADGFSDISSVRASRFIIPDAAANNPRFPEETIAEDAIAPFGDLIVDTTGWDAGTYTLKVVAIDSSDEQSYHHYFRVEVKASASATFARDLFEEIADAQTFANLTNMRFIGREQSSGIFQNGQAFQLQIDSGVLLTTGDFEFWDDGDISADSSLQHSARGDFDIENRVAGFQTQDAAILEADVYCENGQLEIEYQFGSEEYDFYVGDFNDSYMIIIDGAVVTRSPDCADIFAVNTINLDTNRHLFLGDDEDIDPDNNITNQVEYDGLTWKLRAHVFVEPQSTHNVRIIITDVDDGILDSGTFLETDSFRTVTPTP